MPLNKFTAETRASILTAARLGAPKGACARQGGINRNTLYEWLKLAGTDQDTDGEYTKFKDDFEAAMGEGEGKLLHKVQGSDEPRDAQWLLERMYPDEYGAKQRVEIKQQLTAMFNRELNLVIDIIEQECDEATADRILTRVARAVGEQEAEGEVS